MKQTDHEKRPAPGQIVHVVIDRPMNTYHPEHKDLFYPVNYGYIEGIMAQVSFQEQYFKIEMIE